MTQLNRQEAQEEDNSEVESGSELTLSERLRKSLCCCKKGSQGKMFKEILIWIVTLLMLILIWNSDIREDSRDTRRNDSIEQT